MANYQLTYNGLTMGASTVFPFQSVDGLEDLPAVRTGDLDVGFYDGQIPGLDLSAGRSIIVELNVFDSGAGDFFTNVEALKTATTVQPTELPLTYQLPGRNARQVLARPRRRKIPVNVEYGMRYGKAVIEFYATDPKWYDTAFTSNVISLPSAPTGLSFSATAPFVFGSAGTGGSLTVTNSGNYPAPWVAAFAGPLVNPAIALGSSIVTFNGTINAGETLFVDSQGRSVLLNGTASRYFWVTSTSTWWSIPVGTSSVQFTAASGSGTCTFSYRSCWL